MHRTILIVDDSKFVRNMMKAPLAKAGYDVVDVSSPKAAMTKIVLRRPDLIISDLKMPDVQDGFSFLKSLSEQEPDIPVIVYSAERNPDDMSKVLQLGVKSFLKKPVAPADILAKVKAMIGAP